MHIDTTKFIFLEDMIFEDNTSFTGGAISLS